jgi:hypothetical protein
MSHPGFADASMRISLGVPTSLCSPSTLVLMNSRRTFDYRAKHIHSRSSILPLSVLSTLVCFRNISPPHSTCITPIYSCHPSPADWSHAIPPPSIFDYFSCSNIASPRCCTCSISRCERLHLTGRSSFSSFPCSLFSNPCTVLYAYTKYYTIASHHFLRLLHYLLCDSICTLRICMTL